MSRRLLPLLLAALAIVCAAPLAAAVASPGTAAGPAARAAEDVGDDVVCPDELWLEDDTGDVVCEDDVAGDDAGDDDVPLCDDGWIDDEDDGSGEDADADATIATEDDCGDDEEDEAPAPRISALRAAVSGSGRGLRVRVTFRLDRAASVRLTLARVEAGASGSGKRCARRASRKRGTGKGRKGCGRDVALRGGVNVAGRNGSNAAELPRRWSGRALAAGAYRLTATPLGGGATSATTTFRVAAARR